MSSDGSRLTRPRYPMPLYVRTALSQAGLLTAYRQRPAFQQNDYVGWISRAKQERTRLRRLEQMLDELERGDRYMNMSYHAARKK